MIRHIGILMVGVLVVLSHHTLAEQRVIRVGFTEGAPFANIQDGRPVGVAVELWKTIADTYGWAYEFIPYGENANSSVDALAAGKIDVVIGPLSVTHYRHKKVEYTRPYYLNRQGIVVQSQQSDIAFNIKKAALVFYHPIFGGLLVGFLIFGHLYWFAERKYSEYVPESYIKGIGTTIWLLCCQFFGSFFFTRPVTRVGRFLTAIWFICAWLTIVLVYTVVISNLTARMVVSEAKFKSVADLRGLRLAAVQGTTLVDRVKNVGAKPVVTKTLGDAMEALVSGEASGVVMDYSIAKTYIETHRYDDLKMALLTLGNDEYAFAVRIDSPLLRPINLMITKLQDQGTMAALCRPFLGDGARDCEL